MTNEEQSVRDAYADGYNNGLTMLENEDVLIERRLECYKLAVPFVIATHLLSTLDVQIIAKAFYRDIYGGDMPVPAPLNTMNTGAQKS